MVAEPVLSHQLEVRQSRSSNTCPDSYTTSNGLNFTTYCDQDNPFNDAQPPFQSTSMQDCMEHCSRYWGKGEGCFGIVWVQSKNDCWIRNSTTSTKNLHSQPGFYAALLTSGEMTPYDTTCPNDDRSINTLPGVNGMQYTTYCNKLIVAYDNCFSGDPSCFSSPYQGYFHAASLAECLQICVDAHPLCQAVSYNPGLQIGYANCWLKNGFPTTLSAPDSSMGILHSATITHIDTVNSNCPSSKVYKAQGNKQFDIYCGQLNSGSNITSIHTQNITACMDTCSSSNENCVGIVFDPSMQAGFNNCYLQNSTSVITSKASATFAALSGASPSSADGSPSGSGSGSGSGSSSAKSSSKAWIAGPVIGGVIGLALIAAGILFLRRRREKKLANEKLAFGNQHIAPVMEMDAKREPELAATKYAQMHQSASTPHELAADKVVHPDEAKFQTK